jgi:hypothetical protein
MSFRHLRLREQVRQARALAELAVTQGLEGHAADSPENDLWEMAGELAGCEDWLKTVFGCDADKLKASDVIYAARALGIAQGLLLRPELFTNSGER